MSTWPSTKAKKVYRALLKIRWTPKPSERKGSSHVQLIHPERGEYTWAWHDSLELGPVVLKKIGKKTGLTPDDL